jgi:hypothetical protein
VSCDAADRLLSDGAEAPTVSERSMPLASLLRDRFLTLLARGGEQLDWSAIGRLPALDAGISTI